MCQNHVLDNRNRLGFAIFFLLAVLSIGCCIFRDIHIERQHPNDLRNRIVGARLQMDGRSPYFYHWKPADGLRYYDWNNSWPTLQISNITATPFFHQLLYPIANLPQRTISKIWFVLEYIVLGMMMVFALRMATQRKQKYAVVVTVLLFLHCYGWRTGIEQGQMYILIPLMTFLFYVIITSKPSLFHAALAGIISASLLLIRPNTFLFFLPFLFILPRYSVKYKMIFAASLIAVFLAAFGSTHSRSYWSDYRKAIGEHIKLQHGLDPLVTKNPPVPVLNQYEGWNWKQIEQARLFSFHDRTNEQGSVFVLLNMSLHIQTPVWVLYLLCAIFVLILSFFFWRIYKPTDKIGAYTISLLGFYLYMASDLFSPVQRANYNVSQWIFPLLLTASIYSSSINKMWLVGILTGLLLNSLSFYLFPMRHTVGEYVIFASLLGILFTTKLETMTNFKPSINA